MHSTYSKKSPLEFWSYLFNGAPENLAPNEQQALGSELLNRFDATTSRAPQAERIASKMTPAPATRGVQRWCRLCNTTVGLCTTQDKCPSCGVNESWLK